MDYIKERFNLSKYGDEAMKHRNRRARELRKQGYTVECKTVSFMDLARNVSYVLEAKREPTQRGEA